MKHTTKRFLAMIMVLAMCLSLLPGIALAADAYVKVSSVDDITSGGQFIIVANDLAMPTTLSSGKFVGQAVTPSGDTLSGDDLPVWTIEAVSGGIALKSGDKYLAYNSSTNFKMQASAYTWTVTEANGGYVIDSAATTRGVYLQTSSSKFGAYSTQNATASGYVSGLQLYKLSDGTDVPAGCAHQYTSVKTDATCTEDGSEVFTCTLCGDSYTETIKATGHNYVDGTCTACGDTVADLSGDYYIAALRGGNYWYMTSDLGTASTKRYTAIDSGLTELPASIASGLADRTFTVTGNGDGTYSISVEGQYLGWTSGNSGALVAADKALALQIVEVDGAYNIQTTDGTRVLALNSTNGNNYFAFYGGTQVKNLYLIPVAAAGGECAHANTSLVNGKAASCTAEGYTGDTVCADCGETLTVGEVIAALGHSNEDGDNYCDVCGTLVASDISYVKTTALNTGDVVLLINEEAAMELSSMSTTSTIYGIGGGYTDAPVGLMPLTVVVGASEGTVAFQTADGLYLCWVSGNSLKTSDTLDANSSWTVSFEVGGNAVIANNADATRTIRWNKTSPRFACYTSGQADVQLYKQVIGGGCAHTETTLNGAVDATCTEAGYTGDTVCAACGETVTFGSVIEAAGHVETVIPATVTCTKAGLTEGKQCANCDKVYTAQKEANAAGHSYADGICSVCGAAEILAPADAAQILADAYALAAGDALEYTATLNGVITSIDTEYSEQYSNITVTIAVSGNEDKPVQCYRLTGEGIADLAVGDTITVSGNIINYNGTVEFGSGCALLSVVKPVVVTYYVAGSFNSWNPKDEAYLMTANEDGTYSLTINVTAGNHEFKVTDGSWDNSWGSDTGNATFTAASDGTVTITFDGSNVSASGDCLGEKEPMTIISMHVAGNAGLCGAEWDPAANQMDSAMGTYSITFENVAAGTYEFKFVANGTWDLNWASGIAIASGETQTAWFNAMGNSSITVAEDGSTVTLSFNMTTMDLLTGEGATMSAEIVAPEAPAAGALILGDNALTLEANDQDGDSWTFTAAEDGTLFLNVTALSYDWMGEGTYEEAPADQISMGWSRMYTLLINDVAYYTLPVAVEVSAGDALKVQIIANYGYATNLTLALSMGSVVEPEPAEPGTMGNPIVIETLPYEITVDGEHDIYYTYIAEADGILNITYPAGNFVSGLTDYTKADGVYYVNVVAGDEISINPWGSNAGTYTIAYGEAPEIENVNIYFDASLYGWTNVNAYAWDADGNPVSAEWPGSAMTLNEDGIWTIELGSNAAYILFNNGEYYQTGDKDFAADTLYNGINSAIYGTELITNFYVTGDGVFGEWASDNANGIMTNNGNGIYTVTFTGIEAGTYGIKVTDGTWINSWGEWGENVNVEIAEKSDVTVTFNLNEQTVTYEAVPAEVEEPVVIPTLKLKAPALEFKDMIKVIAFFTAENLDDVVEMGMITYTSKVDVVDISTAAHVIPGATFDPSSDRYFASSQGIHAKYLGDTVYLACYAKLTDGSYVYTKLASYSAVTYATNQLKGTDVKLKQLCAAMLNYGAAAQNYFGYNTDVLANSTLTAEQIALPEAYTSDMVQTVSAVDKAKQGVFASNKGFGTRKPAVSFEGAFSINYFFTPNYTPVDGITLYYWTEADFNAADVLTVENASGAVAMKDEGTQFRGDIEGIAAKDLTKAVYVAAVYSDGTTTWTSGVLGYSIGAYCSSQANGTGTMAELAKATAVYGYHANAYFAQ